MREEEYRGTRGPSWEKKRDGDRRWDRPFWTRERKYSPRRLILRSRLPPSLCQRAPYSDKGGVRLRPAASGYFRDRAGEGRAKRRGGRIKGHRPPRRCLILEIALFERRSNARSPSTQPNISAHGIGIGATASHRDQAGIKRRDSAISRPDRAITADRPVKICRCRGPRIRQPPR